MPPKALISKIQQSSTVGANGQLIPSYAVTFSVGDHGPFTETFTKEEFNVPAVQKRLADFAASIGTLTTAN